MQLNAKSELLAQDSVITGENCLPSLFGFKFMRIQYCFMKQNE